MLGAVVKLLLFALIVNPSLWRFGGQLEQPAQHLSIPDTGIADEALARSPHSHKPCTVAGNPPDALRLHPKPGSLHQRQAISTI